MDIVSNSDFEVKKLKDLVKKLERQNEHLRIKTGKLSPYSHIEPDLHKHSSRGSNPIHLSPSEYVSVSELQQIENSDDACWLHASPKSSEYPSKVSLVSWIRKELDHPQIPLLSETRKNILSKLDTAESFDSYNCGILPLDMSPYMVRSRSFDSEIMRPSGSPLPHMSSEHDIFSKMDLNVSESSIFKQRISPESTQSKFTPSHTPQVHHMPLPSQTMTSVHGLIPGGSGTRNRARSPSPRTHTPVRNPDHGSRPVRGESPNRRLASSQAHDRNSTPSRTPQTPRSREPNLRRSMQYYQRGRSPSSRQPNDIITNEQIGNIATPKLQLPSTAHRTQSPQYGSNSPSRKQGYRSATQSKQSRGKEMSYDSQSNSSQDTTHKSQSINGNNTVPRSLNSRRLPRPSQTTRTQYQSPKQSDPLRNSQAGNNKYNDQQYAPPTYSSPQASESGSDVWKDGEFF